MQNISNENTLFYVFILLLGILSTNDHNAFPRSGNFRKCTENEFTENAKCCIESKIWRNKKFKCTVGQNKTKHPYLFHYIYYRTGMKLVTITMDYCLLQFDALKIFLGVHLHEDSQPNFNFFNANIQIFQRNRKVNLTNCLEINFHNSSNISLRVIRLRNDS